jgi:hypothetical protein
MRDRHRLGTLHADIAKLCGGGGAISRGYGHSKWMYIGHTFATAFLSSPSALQQGVSAV